MNQQWVSDPVRDALGGSRSSRGKIEPNRKLKVVTDDLERAANAIIAKYPNSRSATLPLLFLVQAKEGYLTEEGMRDVAQLLGITPADVLASASFYTMFKKKGQGRYLISVCRNISCTHLGSRNVVAALTDRLGIEPGGTTADGLFSLESAECLGTCDGAPAMQINYEDFYRVTPQEAVALVDKLALGEEVRSVRGQPIQTSREISYEIAVTGAYRPQRKNDQTPSPSDSTPVPAEERKEEARVVGGVTLPPDMAPGWRPRVHPEDDDGGDDA